MLSGVDHGLPNLEGGSSPGLTYIGRKARNFWLALHVDAHKDIPRIGLPGCQGHFAVNPRMQTDALKGNFFLQSVLLVGRNHGCKPTSAGGIGGHLCTLGLF